jgi:hypothetical protein
MAGSPFEHRRAKLGRIGRVCVGLLIGRGIAHKLGRAVCDLLGRFGPGRHTSGAVARQAVRVGRFDLARVTARESIGRPLGRARQDAKLAPARDHVARKLAHTLGERFGRSRLGRGRHERHDGRPSAGVGSAGALAQLRGHLCPSGAILGAIVREMTATSVRGARRPRVSLLAEIGPARHRVVDLIIRGRQCRQARTTGELGRAMLRGNAGDMVRKRDHIRGTIDRLPVRQARRQERTKLAGRRAVLVLMRPGDVLRSRGDAQPAGRAGRVRDMVKTVRVSFAGRRSLARRGRGASLGDHRGSPFMKAASARMPAPMRRASAMADASAPRGKYARTVGARW